MKSLRSNAKNNHSSPQVLITRPSGQAEAMCQMLDRLGIKTRLFPVIEIGPTQAPKLAQLSPNTLIIFTSVNAVNYGVAFLYKLNSKIFKYHKVAAIGAKTTQQLNKLNITINILPKAPYNSESLLSSPALSAENINQQSILIVKGEGGRNLLQNKLMQRGAFVHLLPSYRRELPLIEEEQIIDMRNDNIDIIMLTSVESAQNLISLLAKQRLPWLTTARLLLGSQRIANKVMLLGLINPIWIANNPSDESMLDTLTKKLNLPGIEFNAK